MMCMLRAQLGNRMDATQKTVKFKVVVNGGVSNMALFEKEILIVHRLQRFLLKKAGAGTDLLQSNEHLIAAEVEQMSNGAIATYTASPKSPAHAMSWP